MDIGKDLDNVIRKTSKELTAPPPANIPQGFVRYGVVAAKSAGVSTLQFAGDTAIPNVKSLYDNFSVGDTVMVLQYGTDSLTPDLVILGGLRNNYNGEPARLLADAQVNVNTGGACKGKYADGTGSGVTSIAISATDVDIYLGVANVPVKPNRKLRVRLRVTDADMVNNQYRTMTLYSNWNGAGFYAFRRSTEYANGNAGVPLYEPILEEWVFITPTNASTLSLKTYANFNGGTGYFYRYATYTGQDACHMTVEDIGSAEDFIAQGGSFG